MRKYGLVVIGVLIGGFIGFLFRPSVFLIGQLPLAAVITRGATLQGIDKTLVPLAQSSFNLMAVAAIIGGVAGFVVSNVVSKRKS